MKYSAYIMSLFKKYIFSFEGVVAYQIRCSIIMAFDRSFSVLNTHLGEKLRAEAFIYSMMCGDSSETSNNVCGCVNELKCLLDCNKSSCIMKSQFSKDESFTVH